MTMCLADASCRVLQAEAVLSMWLESPRDNYEANLVASIMTILSGVNEAIENADSKLITKKSD
ncbi:hypothetical protein DNM47_01025 [Salmonella enterica subsp. enterica]|uniref:hypothetical protein n=1 Tax=Citrobacter sp. 50677481 TaxID=1736699 RepID=UPI000741CE99|nr:hypothetical protein [Citrobacter sp. 50677481]EAA2606275.1 hypothetical protein [Salmonella enterica subsp. enterica serovar Senftenberg]KSY30986.1 hypothetical protein APU02_03180 [Citrobacter sp. 50677481]HCQ7757216.1 hypothetical protein [Citrobacter sedlakii]